MTVGARFTIQLLREAGIAPGMSVLDIGCGGGLLTRDVAELVGPGGRVLGIDRNPMVLNLADVTPASGKSRIDYRQVDLAALPDDLGSFDAIVGRRVLMYLESPGSVLAALAERLNPGGMIAVHEHNNAPLPNRISMPAHEEAQGWIFDTIRAEGTEPEIGFMLYDLLIGAGLTGVTLKVEANVQTPDQPYALASIVRGMKGRAMRFGVVADEAEMRLDTLDERLAAEAATGTWLADLMFGAWGRKP